MNPQDRFCVHTRHGEPVYTSQTLDGVVSYLWGRDVTAYRLYAYEVPVPLLADLGQLRLNLYALVLDLTHGRGVEESL